jgi:hypothetical protein
MSLHGLLKGYLYFFYHKWYLHLILWSSEIQETAFGSRRGLRKLPLTAGHIVDNVQSILLK